MIKSFVLTPDYVLWEMSYDNIILYNSILPSYGSDDKKEEEKEVDFDDLESELL